MTEVVLGWACGSLKAINTGPEYKATVSAAEKTGKRRFIRRLCRVCLFLRGKPHTKVKTRPPFQGVWSLKWGFITMCDTPQICRPPSEKGPAHCYSAVSWQAPIVFGWAVFSFSYFSPPTRTGGVTAKAKATSRLSWFEKWAGFLLFFFRFGLLCQPQTSDILKIKIKDLQGIS